MSNAEGEFTAVPSIWNDVVARRPVYAIDLSDMLLSSKPEYSNVTMAKKIFAKATVSNFKDHVFSDTTKWFYIAEGKSQVKCPFTHAKNHSH